MENHSGNLLAVIRKMIRDQVEAEDILQDVFTEFIETYDLGQAIGTLGGWLVQVAKNKTLDRFRRRKTQDEYLLVASRDQDAAENLDPEEESVRGWIREEIIEALQMLPQSQRDVFIMHELEGKSFEQIAQETGLSINTLLSQKRYAVIYLRNHLKEIYNELDE